MYGFERGFTLGRDCLVSFFTIEALPTQIATKSPPEIDDGKRLENKSTPEPAFYKGLGRLKRGLEIIRNLGP